MLTQSELLREIAYDPESGYFKRLGLVRGPVTEQAGTVNLQGYRKINILGRRYAAHRLAWLCVHGEMPSGDVDHINGIRDDNRLANLRVVSQSQNTQNTLESAANKSGRKGVSWHAQSGKWRASIGINGRKHSYGLYVSKADAIRAREQAELDHFTHNDRLVSRQAQGLV